ncbi:hypothetical protein JHK82_025165 [Glycine max]|nr:hypothetical protein JHK82_025165 [Glycine max]
MARGRFGSGELLRFQPRGDAPHDTFSGVRKFNSIIFTFWNFLSRRWQSQNIVNSHLSSSFVNSSSTVPGAGCSNLGPVSGDINNAVLNTVANSAPSVGASSLVTYANSALSGGPHLQRSAKATYEVLPRFNEIKFGGGVIDELLFLDLPRETRFPSGAMMLEYAKAVQESVYEPLRVVREGQLRIIFTQDLKILSWEFCARRHEELLPRRLVAPQVNQLIQVAQKCQSTIAESRADWVSQQDLQTNSNMEVAKAVSDKVIVAHLGLSMFCVVIISEVVNSMKDLIDICAEHKIGAIGNLLMVFMTILPD